jgi:hypothetical protein
MRSWLMNPSVWTNIGSVFASRRARLKGLMPNEIACSAVAGDLKTFGCNAILLSLSLSLFLGLSQACLECLSHDPNVGLLKDVSVVARNLMNLQSPRNQVVPAQLRIETPG